MEARSVEAIVRALGSANVQYLIVEGLAVNAHGYERLTRDVDLVIGLEPGNIARGLHALQEIGYEMAVPVTPEEFADPVQRESWRREKSMIVLKLWSDGHRRTPVDVFVYEPFDFPREFVAAHWLPVAGDLRAPVAFLFRPAGHEAGSGREKDLLDVQSLRKLDPYR